MKIEITNGAETPVTKFFSAAPEIDSTIVQRLCIHKRDGSIQHMELIDAEVARKLQQERDEAREALEHIVECERDKWEQDALRYCKNSEYHREMREKAERERDEAREIAGRLAHFLERPAYSVDEAIARMEALNSYKKQKSQ
jgi:hypothetical protein